MAVYICACEAARVLGIPYQTLMSRIRRGKLSARKVGPGVFIPEQEVLDNAHNQNLVKSARKVFLPLDEAQEPLKGHPAEGPLV